MTAKLRRKKFLAECYKQRETSPQPPDKADYEPIWKDIRSEAMCWIGDCEVVVDVDFCNTEETKWLMEMVKACGFKIKSIDGKEIKNV